MPDDLASLLKALLASIGDHNAALAAERVSVDRWQQLVATDLLATHYAAYMVGKETRTLTDSEQQQINDTVGAQLDYLNAFADAIDTTGWKDGYGARALLYAGSIKESYWRGRTTTWDLPYYPAQGTDCLTNCLCAWEPGSLDTEELTGEWYWRRAADDSCDTCLQRANETPIRFVAGERV